MRTGVIRIGHADTCGVVGCACDRTGQLPATADHHTGHQGRTQRARRAAHRSTCDDRASAAGLLGAGGRSRTRAGPSRVPEATSAGEASLREAHSACGCSEHRGRGRDRAAAGRPAAPHQAEEGATLRARSHLGGGQAEEPRGPRSRGAYPRRKRRTPRKPPRTLTWSAMSPSSLRDLRGREEGPRPALLRRSPTTPWRPGAASRVTGQRRQGRGQTTWPNLAPGSITTTAFLASSLAVAVSPALRYLRTAETGSAEGSTLRVRPSRSTRLPTNA